MRPLGANPHHRSRRFRQAALVVAGRLGGVRARFAIAVGRSTSLPFRRAARRRTLPAAPSPPDVALSGGPSPGASTRRSTRASTRRSTRAGFCAKQLKSRNLLRKDPFQHTPTLSRYFPRRGSANGDCTRATTRAYTRRYTRAVFCAKPLNNKNLPCTDATGAPSPEARTTVVSLEHLEDLPQQLRVSVIVAGTPKRPDG
jgi:hypothetical protein